MRISIIGGTGKMGRWFTEFLLKDGKEVTIYGRNEERLREAGLKYNVRTATSLHRVVDGADIVLLSVPIDNFKKAVRQLKPCLSSGQIVMDITSVKAMPVEVMQRYLSDNTILGTHPVFGPGARSVRNQNFVLMPTNDTEAAFAGKVREYLDKKGALVTLMTPEEHDDMMAVVLGLAHFIAIASADVLFGFEQLVKMKAIGGPTYKVLLTLAESVITEDPELYASIQMNLPRMDEMESLFQKSAGTWADIVKKRDRRAFVQRMNALKETLSKADPEFGRSYEDMYEVLDEK